MTAVAHVGQDDALRSLVNIWIGDETEQGITQVLAGDVRKFIPNGEMDTEPTPSIRLREDQARALLQALIRYFDGGEDTRSLRKDYDAERKRVDLLIDKLANVLVVPS